MKRVLEILSRVRPEFDFSASDNYIDDGMLDSLDVITLVSDLDHEFKIGIEGTDIVPENFRNLKAILQLLGKYGVNG